MELKWLEDFVSVAKLRNFSHAAAARHATQPAISRRVKALENWYGVPLFDRSTYPVALTEAGVQFLRLAEQVVADLYRSRREARAAHERSDKAICFAMPHSLAGAFFARWWHKQPRKSEVCAAVIAADFDECVEMLLSGACEFLICYRHSAVPIGLDAGNVSCKRIGNDLLLPVSARGDGGNARFDLSVGTHTVLPLLSYTRTSFLGRVASALQVRLESQTNVVLRFETALVEALKAEVLLGEGVAWLPESMIATELNSGKLLVVGDVLLTAPLEISLCRLAGAVAGLQNLLDGIWESAS